MAENKTVLIDVAALRIGMFVYLDLGWMAHPFPSSSFKISNEKQLQAIRSLNLSQVRYSAEKSDPLPGDEVQLDATGAAPTQPDVDEMAQVKAALAAQRKEQLALQKSRFARCEKNFSQAAQACMQVMNVVATQPDMAIEK